RCPPRPARRQAADRPTGLRRASASSISWLSGCISLAACVLMTIPKLSLRLPIGRPQIVEQIRIRRLRVLVKHPERGTESMGALVVGAKALVDAAGAVALHYLDHLAVALDITAGLKFGACFDDRLHLGEDQRGLELVVGGGVDLTARFAFGAEEMTQGEAGNEPGLAVTAGLALDCNVDFATPICRNAAVNRLHELMLAR